VVPIQAASGVSAEVLAVDEPHVNRVRADLA
jgi:hypothetical protein